MKRNAYRKELWRAITRSFSRFLAIAGIVAMGAGFLAGLTACKPDMQLTADKYYDDTNMMDFRVLSTLGLTDADVEALGAVEGIESVMPANYIDQEVTIREQDYLVRIHSLPESAESPSGEESAINELVLLEGRMPTAGTAECVINPGKTEAAGVDIGDVIRIHNAEDDLEYSVYTVVGLVRSSLYLSFSFGSTTMGNGSLDYAMYVPRDDFKADYYTEIYMTTTGTDELNAFAGGYEETIETVKARIEELQEEREEARYQEVVGEARDALDDGYAEFNDAKTEALNELNDAEQELDDGEAELRKAADEIADGWEQYEDGARQLDEQRVEVYEQLAEAQALLLEAQKQADSGKDELDASYEQLMTAKTTLDSTRAELDAAREMLEQQETEIHAAGEQIQAYEKELELKKAELDAAEEELASQRAVLDAMKLQLDEQGKVFAEMEVTLQEMEQELAAMEAQLQQEEQEIENLKVTIEQLKEDGKNEEAQVYEEELAALEAAHAENTSRCAAYRQVYEEQMGSYTTGLAAYQNEQECYKSFEDAYGTAVGGLAEGRNLYEAGAAGFAEQKTAYEQGLAVYENAVAQYESGEQQWQAGYSDWQKGMTAWNVGYDEWKAGQKEIQDGLLELEDSREEAEAALEEAETVLAESKQDLENGEEELAEAEKELADGRKEYEEAKADADQELADAEKELLDAEADIAEIEYPEWYVLTREENEGFVSYKNDAARMGSIATVFPWLFFFVAALVSLTSMTRMVEEERVLIGTYKALGFSKGKIAWKYICYALSASLLGSAVGIPVLMWLLPYVVVEAYGTMYIIESATITPFHISYTLISAGAASLCTIGATMMACYRSFMEVPAALMMPAAPKAGRRILLERIAFLWKKLPFSYKVTARNLFRYKKRMFMTIVGVSGCTALLLVGFGIEDSVSGILSKQYGEIYQYDMILGMEEEADWEDIYGSVKDIEGIEGVQAIQIKNSAARSSEGTSDVSLYVPQDLESLEQFVNLKVRRSQEPVAMTEDTVLLTEKLATKLSLGVGDTIQIQSENEKYKDLTVGGIVEHYVGDYVYICRDLYEAEIADVWTPNEFIVCTDENVEEEVLISNIRDAAPDVTTIQNIEDTTVTFQAMMDSLNLVIIVIIIAAGLLALIVLYNLTNINITERKREIATIKVLGFYDGEVNAYIYRETVVLTILGCIGGLLLGILLHRFVIHTVEVDMVMFSRVIDASSYIFSAVITMIFSVLVNLIMNKKLKKISMVESLKSVD